MSTPKEIPFSYFYHNWLARAAHAMGQHDISMGDTSLRHTRTGGQQKYHPLSASLPPQVLVHLTQRNIHLVGQLATPDGLRLIRPITLGINPNVSTWWQQVVESLCTHGHPLLATTPVSPKHTPLFRPCRPHTPPALVHHHA